jgi:hypothetical protein
LIHKRFNWFLLFSCFVASTFVLSELGVVTAGWSCVLMECVTTTLLFVGDQQ